MPALQQLSVAACATILVLLTDLCAGADGVATKHVGDIVEFSIALDDRGRYAAREAWAAAERLAGEPLDASAKFCDQDELLTITPGDRLAILLAREAGLLDADISPQRITIRIPKPTTPAARARARSLIQRWLHLPSSRWTERYGLRRPDGIAKGRVAWVLIPGLESTEADCERFVNACVSRRIPLGLFIFPNDGPAADSAEHLAADLAAWHEDDPAQRFFLVGHSLGGLIACDAAARPEAPNTAINGVATMGAPFAGSALADYVDVLELAVQLLPLESGEFGEAAADGLGEAGDDLARGSDFLQRLDERLRKTAPPLYCAAGDTPFINATTQDALSRECERLRRRHPQERAWEELERLCTLDEMTPGKGDGAVAVASALSKYAVRSRTFPVNHRQFLSLPGDSPADHDVFRWLIEVEAALAAETER